jgi:hypothetical protein
MRKGATLTPEVRMPLLPSSLIDAFADILILHVDMADIATMATTLSKPNVQRNHGPVTLSGGLARRIWQYKWRHKGPQDAIHGYLDYAREELIRGIAAQRSSNVRLGPVGPEFIVAAALGNAQRGAPSRLSGLRKLIQAHLQ